MIRVCVIVGGPASGGAGQGRASTPNTRASLTTTHGVFGRDSGSGCLDPIARRLSEAASPSLLNSEAQYTSSQLFMWPCR